MIHVDQVTKSYGEIRAITDVSFSVGKGEVVGLLGPNGAGKTTTMRILCGCIGATQGRAIIDGQDVVEYPTEVKRRIGYLPENPPLYGSMTAEDYIEFAARIKGVKDVTAAVDRVINRVGLQSMRHRIIDHLSKGYRQRVGIAQALVHDPDVLVLDEPTSGLDPAQRMEIRKLLQELAEGDRTVVLSTHVLSEVESVCERVIIINKGQVVAQDRIENLVSESRRVRLRVARPSDDFVQKMEQIPGVAAVASHPDGAWLLSITDEPDNDVDIREVVAKTAVPFGLLELSPTQNLEAIYLRLTGVST